jgi:predicted RNA methylase
MKDPLLTAEQMDDFTSRVSVHFCKGEREFFEDNKTKHIKFDHVVTDKPYGLNQSDGTSDDKAISSADVVAITKAWAHVLRNSPTANVLVRMHFWQISEWKNALEDAGFLVTPYGCLTRKKGNQGWSRKNQLGLRAVGDFWMVAHKVPSPPPFFRAHFLSLLSLVSPCFTTQHTHHPQTRDYTFHDVTTKWLPQNEFGPKDACISGIFPVPAAYRLRDVDGRTLRASQMNTYEAMTLIERYTNPGDTILDGSCGTGAIPIAALRTGRRAVALDKDHHALCLAAIRIKQAYKNFVTNGLLTVGDIHNTLPPQKVELTSQRPIWQHSTQSNSHAR